MQRLRLPASGPARWKGDQWPIAFLVGFGLVIGLLIATDFGVSIDEPGNADVGKYALRAYAGSQIYFNNYDTLAEHGPAYFMFFYASSKALVSVFRDWLVPDGRHFTNYITFLAGLYAFYVICLRLTRRLPALVATALFATQPMLFGSAFINQKDIPFMVLFMAVIALGLAAAYRPRSTQTPEPAPATGALRAFARRLRSEWRAVDSRRRRALTAWSVLGLVLLLDLFVVGLAHRLGEGLIAAAFNGQAPWPVQDLFTRIATDAYKTPLSLYLGRYETLFAVTRLALAGLAAVAAIAAYRRSLPSLAGVLDRDWPNDRYPALLIGALLLGLTICVRQIGLFAGGLVSLYLLYRRRLGAILPLAIYWFAAFLVTYATWPYLWLDPIQNALNSFSIVQNFGAHEVFFRGRVYLSNALPWDYFPTLAGLQLTEPAIGLFGLGSATIAWRFLKGRTSRLLVGLVVAWFGIPVLWLIFRGVPIYNSIRHFFFVLPPLFILAGVGIDALLHLTRRPWLQACMVVLALAPGVWGIVSLHPYEYAYYNSFIGGVNGAFDQFEVDYWCLSLKEATKFVNQVAEPGEIVRVLGPVQSVAPYVREDLLQSGLRAPIPSADMVLVCPIEPRRPWDKSDFQLVHEVTMGRAVLTEVWQRVGPSGAASATDSAGMARHASLARPFDPARPPPAGRDASRRGAPGCCVGIKELPPRSPVDKLRLRY